MTSIVQRRKTPEQIAREQAYASITGPAPTTTTTAKAPAPAPTAVAPAPSGTSTALPKTTTTTAPKVVAQTAPKLPTSPLSFAAPTPLPTNQMGTVTQTSARPTARPTNNIPTAPTGSTSSGMSTGGGGINVVGNGNREDTAGQSTYVPPTRGAARTGMATQSTQSTQEQKGLTAADQFAITGKGDGVDALDKYAIGATGGGGGGREAIPTNDPNTDSASGLEWKDAITGGGGREAIPGQQSIDQMAEDLARKQLAAALAGGDTAEHQRLLAELSDKATGRSVVNARSAGGRAGMGMSGNMAAMSNDIRQNAGRQLGLDQIGVRTAEEQRVLGNANEAQRIDIAQRTAASDLADAQSRRAALAAILGEGMGPGGAEEPAAGGGGGVGGALDDALDDVGGTIGDASGISDGTSPFGKGTDQTELASAPEREAVSVESDPGSAMVVQAPPTGYRQTSIYTDPSTGQKFTVYTDPKTGKVVRVRGVMGF